MILSLYNYSNSLIIFQNFLKIDIEIANINVAKYGVLNDLKGNLTKARTILKKSLDSISLARALISRSDKSFLCDKEYVSEIFYLKYKMSIYLL